MAPCVVDPTLETMPETLRGGELEAVIMTVCARGELGYRGEPGM